MIRSDQVSSGFDVEVLLSAGYIRYILLSAFDSGDLPARTTLDFAGISLTLAIHPARQIRREYRPEPVKFPQPATGSFAVNLLFEDPLGADLQVALVTDLSLTLIPSSPPVTFPSVTLTLQVVFALRESLDGDGQVVGTQLYIDVVGIQASDTTVQQVIDANLPAVLAGINELLAGVVPDDLFPTDSPIQSAATRKFEGGGSTEDAIGFYLNFEWRDGPLESDIRPDRGNTALAVNFLPSGQDLAFGMPAEVYDFLSADAMNRLAEPILKAGDSYYYPIRGGDGPNSPDLGEIFSVDIGHARRRLTLEDGTKGKLRDALSVSIRGQYFVSGAYKPNFHLTIDLIPVLSSKRLEWRLEYDIDVNLLAEALPMLFLFSMAFVFGPAGIVLGTQLAALALAAQETQVEPLALEEISGDVEAQASEAASLLDAIPHRVTIASRRWDPFYWTDHQVLALLNFFALDPDGIRLHGKATLDKEVRPVDHVVLRDEERDESGQVERLVYRVKDHRAHRHTFTEAAPAVDRRDFDQLFAKGDATDSFALTLDQVLARIDEARIRARITYLPRRVDIRRNQVRRILAISQTEKDEIEAALITGRRGFLHDREIKIRGDELQWQVVPELAAELGRIPTPDEIDARIDQIIDEDTKGELQAYIDNLLPAQLEEGVEAAAQLDLSPHEFGTFEEQLIMAIRGFDRVKRERTYYYRDRADRSLDDNLMSLPGFKTDDALS